MLELGPRVVHRPVAARVLDQPVEGASRDAASSRCGRPRGDRTVPGMGTVRIGILGAARIAPAAVIKPARNVGEAEIGAVAARDRSRADAFASKHGIPKVHDSYAALDRRSRHRRDLQPAPQRPARRVDDRRARSGQARAVREAVHREREGGRSRRRGRGAHRPRRDGGVPLPVPPARAAHARDRRERRARRRSGGSRPRCASRSPSSPTSATSTTSRAARRWTSARYTVHMARLLGCEEPEVVSAEAKLRTPDVDRAMRAELTFPSGHTGRITCSMWSRWVIQTYARVIGDAGRDARDQPDRAAAVAPHAGEERRQHAAPSSSRAGPPTSTSSRRSARPCCGANRR